MALPKGPMRPRGKRPSLREQAVAVDAQVRRAMANDDCQGFVFRLAELKHLFGVARRKKQDVSDVGGDYRWREQMLARCTRSAPKDYSRLAEETAERGRQLELKGPRPRRRR